MKIKMEANDRQKGFFHKKHCPKCGQNSKETTCKSCGVSFSNDDFWMPKLW
ncbi:MAG: hypothetical protein OEZ13_06460 [Spirochaetia bacterium]|nr:hypothetical protein [Spirochaetia bacterium]